MGNPCFVLPHRNRHHPSPQFFSVPLSFFLLQGELKEDPSLWPACSSVLARALGICALKTAPPYGPIRTDVPLFTHKLKFINKFRGRSFQYHGTCWCACAHVQAGSEVKGGQRGSCSVILCHVLLRHVSQWPGARQVARKPHHVHQAQRWGSRPA